MKEIRVNVLVLALFGVGLCVGMGWFLAEGDIAMIVGVLIGGLVSVMTKLVQPPDPEVDPMVPSHIVEKLIEKFPDIGTEEEAAEVPKATSARS